MRVPLLLLLLAWVVRASAAHPPTALFTGNNGQWPAQVLYRTLVPGGALFVEDRALTVSLHQGGPFDHQAHVEGTSPAPLRQHAYRVHFEGAQAAAGVGARQQPQVESFFLGNDPARWGRCCPVFGQVRLQGLYPGIDLRIDGADGLKYDLLVAAGADPSAIAMRYEGHDRLRIDHGRLIVQTSVGEVVEEVPVAYQEYAGRRIPVDCRYRLVGDVVTFELPAGYDRTLPLVIDPVLTFASYSGSAANNFGFTATNDADGRLYGGGIVFSNGYPVTLGAWDSDFNGGSIDIGISKFSSDGSQLIWSTYIGGSANETPQSLVVNAQEELYVLGSTSSANYPTTPGAYDESFNGGTAITSWAGLGGGGYGYGHPAGTDIVLTRLRSDASDLVASTFVGGSRNDGLNNVLPLAYNYGDAYRGEVVLDAQQRPVVATSTESTDIPVSPNAHQPAFGGGAQDAYFFRMDAALTTLSATFFGGSGNDSGYGVQLATTGEPYFTGGTTSTDLPMAGNPHQSVDSGGVDGYIARFAPGTGALISSTYLGTSAYDQSYFIQLNEVDQVFVVGQTHGEYPVTPGKYSVPQSTQFVQKFSKDLSTSIWSTRVGSPDPVWEDISPSAFLVSNCDQIYFSGWAGAVNHHGPANGSTTVGLPVTSNAFRSTTDGSDFYLLQLNGDASALKYATFFGGPSSPEHVDGGTSRFDKSGNVYQAVCAGCQNNDDFPTTPGAWSGTNGANGCNLGVFKFNLTETEVAPDTALCIGASVQLAAGGGVAYQWTPAGSLDDPTSPTPIASPLDTTTYVVRITTPDGCIVKDSLVVNVQHSTPVPQLEDEQVCFGDSVRIFSNGADHYAWRPAPGISDLTVAGPYVSPPASMYYAVASTNLCGTVWDSLFVEVQRVIATAWPDTVCRGDSLLLRAAGGIAYEWSPGSLDPRPGGTAMATAQEAFDYTVVVSNALGCSDTATARIDLFPDPSVYAGQDRTVPYGHPIDLHASGAGEIIWTADPTLSCDSCRSPVATPLISTTYTVQLTDTNGCRAFDQVTIFVEGTLFVPNTFTPDGDRINDEFRVLASEVKEFRLLVFDRWGRKVYESDQPGRAWDGSYLGVPAPIDTYVWRVDLTELNGEDRTFYGHVNLLR